MASALVSHLITDLQKPGLMPGLEEECQKLLNLLLVIVPVVPDVEWITENPSFRPPTANVMRAENWLMNLKAATYDAEDIIDEFRYAKLHAEVETHQRRSGHNIRASIFSLCKIGGTRVPSKSKEGMMQEIVRGRLKTIVNKFDNLVEQSTDFISQEAGSGLFPSDEGWQDPILSNLNQIDPIIVGRDEDKEEIVHKLLDLSQTVGNTIRVLSIVAADGIGKTTLARFICGDDRIKDHFELILWVHVGPEDFKASRIVKSMIDQVIGRDCCISEGDTDLLGHRINQELTGKRYLLVLDEVFYLFEDMWQPLKSWLDQSAATGSSLLVTTSRKEVADIMSSESICELPPLRENDLWTLFCRRALHVEKEINLEVLEASRRLIKAFSVLPLHVNLIGGLMRFKKEPEDWQQVIHQLGGPESLFLCYFHLPSDIKQCLLFCSVFPNGRYMDKEELIKLWMANGLFSSDESISLEEKGNRIFNELVLRQFFEDVKLVPESSSRDKHGYHSRIICKMHGFTHTLASLIMKNGYMLKVSPTRFSNQTRYQSINVESIDIPLLLDDIPHLRTLISLDDPFVKNVKCSLLSESNSLRALQLHSALFYKDLFELKYARHLRYLDLSGSRIEKLPESTSTLYHLQTLNLSRCLLLCQLPQDMCYMRSLRHLYVHGCPKLKKMPQHLGQLRSLKTLTTYIVGENAGNDINELKYLNNIGGLVELYNLGKVKNATNAIGVPLLTKTNLERLTLCWGGHRLVMSKENNDLGVLEALQPHNGLKVLKIQQYGDQKFATWLADPVDLLNLVELHLIGCSKCETLPSVWKLPFLRVLCLKHMSSISSFPGIDKKDSSKPFPSLKRLVLISMMKLKRWYNGEAMQGTMLSFPMLDEMEIIHCPELTTMPIVPMLKYLMITTENHGLVTSVIDLMAKSTSLIEVDMTKGNGSDNEVLSALGAEVEVPNSHKLRILRLDSTNSFFMARAITNSWLRVWRSLVSLENLVISNCSSIYDWPLEEFRNLSKLKRLTMRMCPYLTGKLPRELQEGEELLPQLQSLEFYRCLSLKEVPRCSSILYLELDECPDINSILGLNNVEMLFLSCTSWESLPDGFGDLMKLKSLRVSECYSLTCLPNELAGLTSLRTLIINKCSRVISLPEGLNEMLGSLEKFEISDCPELEKFCREEPYSSIINQIYRRRYNSF